MNTKKKYVQITHVSTAERASRDTLTLDVNAQTTGMDPFVNTELISLPDVQIHHVLTAEHAQTYNLLDINVNAPLIL